MILKSIMTNLFEERTLEYKYDEVHDISHKYKEILFSCIIKNPKKLESNPHISFYILKPNLDKEIRIFQTYQNSLEGENYPGSFDKYGNIVIKTQNCFP